MKIFTWQTVKRKSTPSLLPASIYTYSGIFIAFISWKHQNIHSNKLFLFWKNVGKENNTYNKMISFHVLIIYTLLIIQTVCNVILDCFLYLLIQAFLHTLLCNTLNSQSHLILPGLGEFVNSQGVYLWLFKVHYLGLDQNRCGSFL